MEPATITAIGAPWQLVFILIVSLDSFLLKKRLAQLSYKNPNVRRIGGLGAEIRRQLQTGEIKTSVTQSQVTLPSDGRCAPVHLLFFARVFALFPQRH